MPFQPLRWTAMAFVLGAAFLYQNCSRPERKPSSVDEESVAAVPFETGKLQSSLGENLAAETSFILIVRNTCAAETPGPLSGQLDLSGRHENLQVQSYSLALSQAMSASALSDLAERDACVIGLANDAQMHAGQVNDSSFGSQKNLLSVGGAETFRFFNDPLRGSRAPIVVAVIDSGIATDHADLKRMLWTDPSDQSHGYNFRTDTTNAADDFGHGSAVSGIIGAEANNGFGIAGVMGHDIQLMALKVQNSQGDAYISDIVEALDFARAHSADVINISMEGSGANAALQSALLNAVNAGSFIAVAAGNGGAEITPSRIIVPASYANGSSGILAVGSTDAVTGARSTFSNYGPTYVEIAAPGSNGVMYTHFSGGISSGQGTSYSSPMVAGAAALTISFLKKNGISYTPATIKSLLLNSAKKDSNLTGAFGQGRVLDLNGLADTLRRTYIAPLSGGLNE